MSLRFSTKAGTLANLKGLLASAEILPLVSLTVAEWQSDRASCFARVLEALGPVPLIVRSSCGLEDGEARSNAGAFLSVKDVSPRKLEDAVFEVIASYGRIDPDDEVLVQPMLDNVLRSGVAFTHDPNTASPYRVVNWTEGSNTAAVTGGLNGQAYQRAALAKTPIPANLVPIIALLEELECLFGVQPIDCEFAVTGSAGDGEKLWLLQARPLLLSRPAQSPQLQAERLGQIEAKVRRGMQPHPFVMGSRTVYGVMPDWNPAEIVGIRPKPLALSLYRELVTDSIWAYQRNNYGYRNLRSFPLMPHFFGLPYIDVRLSFNSFIPADIEDGLAGRLADYYLDKLLAEPTLHDKIEFEIVHSCYTLDIADRLAPLSDKGFSKNELDAIRTSLRALTNRVIDPQDGYWRVDAEKLDTLEVRRKTLTASSDDLLERIYWLIEDGKRYGTLPFAGLARAAFIAVQMLKSLVSVGILTEAEKDAFMASVSTVGRQLASDRRTMDQAAFLERYGHLRPGTYDLLSPRYDECPDLYFDWKLTNETEHDVRPFSLSAMQERELNRLLKRHELKTDAQQLINFMRNAIELREYAKFLFTRNLSDAMQHIIELGKELGFDVGELVYSDIAAFREMHVAAVDCNSILRASIEQGRARHEDTIHLSLPPLITEPSDIWGFEWPEAEPNYITQKQVTAAVVSTAEMSALAGAIVCIPNADPGFDWLFSHNIGGLITAWGGVNSHMAIRAGELGLPAVIGAGEMHYRKWAAADRLHMDCSGRRVELVA